jgi:hypothetical protein
MSKDQRAGEDDADAKLRLAQDLTRAALMAAYEAGSSNEVLDLLLDALRELADEATAEKALIN